LSSVLEVIYLIFNEGYAATAGEHWTRPALCEEALRPGRIPAGMRLVKNDLGRGVRFAIEAGMRAARAPVVVRPGLREFVMRQP